MEKTKAKKVKSVQDIQDNIFKKMSAQKKIHLVSELSAFCLKLNSLNGNIKSRKTSCKHS
jgi:hypothetical protein